MIPPKFTITILGEKNKLKLDFHTRYIVKRIYMIPPKILFTILGFLKWNPRHSGVQVDIT